MGERETFYITSPIYYVNDKPHIGHAYTGLACDVMARYWRLRGREVYFLTGTDEHGQKVEQAAAIAGESPQEFTDRFSEKFRDLARVMNFSHDDFIRTTEGRHKIGVQALWRKLVDAGEIYLGEYEGWYAVRDEAFYAEGELTKGEGGQLFAPSGAEVKWVSEPSYFFRLSGWGDRLLKFYDKHADCIAPQSRRNEVISFVKNGLKDLSISRTSFSWGVSVPDDDKHIMYVWLDALANYLTALGYGSEDESLYKKFWPADLHIVGKDILRFHAVYWHAFLLAAGIEPPKLVFAHGWWTNEGKKISKSLGNVIDPYDLIEKYGLDQVRYFLLREIPFGNDGDFSHQTMVRRINHDLANDLGNLCQRVLSFTYKHCEAKIPCCGKTSNKHYGLESAESVFRARVLNMYNNMYGIKGEKAYSMEEQAFHVVLLEIWEAITAANIYVNDSAPWALLKNNDKEQMQTVLYLSLCAIYEFGVILQPFMPDTSVKIFKSLGIDKDEILFRDKTPKDIEEWIKVIREEGNLIEGSVLPEPVALFPRIREDGN